MKIVKTMNSEGIVRRELKELRYYYSRKSNMDELFHETGETEVVSIAKRYNEYIKGATARLYDLYGCLYLQNKTQDSVAIELGYTQEYIRRLHNRLVAYFCECLKNEEV